MPIRSKDVTVDIQTKVDLNSISCCVVVKIGLLQKLKVQVKGHEAIINGELYNKVSYCSCCVTHHFTLWYQVCEKTTCNINVLFLVINQVLTIRF